jgi:hypothetical protein
VPPTTITRYLEASEQVEQTLGRSDANRLEHFDIALIEPRDVGDGIVH